MKSFNVNVSMDVMIWARRSNGLSTEEAAQKIGVSQVELRMWEEGAEEPSIERLRAVARAYGYPLAVLLLPEPPSGIAVLRDFRLLPENQGGQLSPELRKQLRRIHYQQEVAREIAAAEGGFPPAIEINLSTADPTEKSARTILSWLEEGSALGAEHAYPDLTEWIRRIEHKGILVTHVQGVDVDEMRGCSFGTRPFPAIVLNGKDSRTGRLFTLLHELVHVLLAEEAICDLGPSVAKVPTQIDSIERYCDSISAEILMPSAALLADPTLRRANVESEWTPDELHELAAPFHTSSEAMLRRLVTLGKTSMDFYWRMRPIFIRAYQEHREREEAKQKSTDGGPSPYLLKIRNFGRRFIGDVLDAYDRDLIDLSDVSDYLDIKVNNIPKLITRMNA